MIDFTPSNKKLQGMVVIIIGGASNIGEATTCHFAAHDVRVIVIADVQDEKGQNVAASIGPNICAYVHCNVSGEYQVKTLVDTTVNTYGHLDIMFSNSGMARVMYTCDQSVLDMELSAYNKLMVVNGLGMAVCVKRAAKATVEGRARGSIVCITSMLASIGFPNYVDYGMSKHAMLGLVRSACLHVGVYEIRVNCVY